MRQRRPPSDVSISKGERCQRAAGGAEEHELARRVTGSLVSVQQRRVKSRSAQLRVDCFIVVTINEHFQIATVFEKMQLVCK